MNRYPVERQVYIKGIGRLRVENIARILERDFHFDVAINAVEANDVDMQLSKDNKLFCVSEIINWNVYSSYLGCHRKFRIISNLTKYDVHRVLICSFLSNLRYETGSYIQEIESNDIKIIALGFQTQPDDWYLWFKERYPEFTDKRPISDPEVTKTIKNKLSYLRTLKPKSEVHRPEVPS